MPGLAPEPPHVSQAACRMKRTIFDRAVGGLDQVERHFAADVAALADPAAAAAAAAEDVAEKALAEDVAEGVEDVGHVVEVRRTAPFQAGVPVAIVAWPASRGG